ncbi:hypothetical protein O181_028144 [Austropuccinia psidii MF-1]|uniref:Uncharacterized protein n=1 Tax=Austropuccinia psidii MF-1 TaxID=1389203 RepID=A0A9Q3CNB1_9BASI|nr:hypothetical protein [Austropuccinia psidii MF-1]
MSLKAQTHFNTIRNVWVITPHGATKQFGILTFVDEMTSTPLPGHLTPLPCLLSRLNLLPHPRPILPMLSMLRCPHHPPDEAPTLPSPLLTIFMLTECPPNMALTPHTILMLTWCPPDMPPTQLTILTLT